jgi:hypothetical protein
MHIFNSFLRACDKKHCRWFISHLTRISARKLHLCALHPKLWKEMFKIVGEYFTQVFMQLKLDLQISKKCGMCEHAR